MGVLKLTNSKIHKMKNTSYNLALEYGQYFYTIPLYIYKTI
ncbi:hypothetical protein GGR42_003362 [Saonia flava]|uniref:Uncharacterized protein n=1 Tax=Saonia flava TaxID=523696 RepID=A0A846R653_9FLAO|nr:hypothetical protein [Saonia flava]